MGSRQYEDDDIVILGGYRTPIGNLNGCLASLPAHELGAAVIKRLIDECKIPVEQISEVVLGQALAAGQGSNPVRQAAVKGGIPYSVPAYGVSFLCGSGLRAVVNAYHSVKAGDASFVIAGGQESMSCAPHCVNMRAGTKFGDASMKDTMLNDSLIDPFYSYHMGVTAENIAKEKMIKREDQDEFAAGSQKKIAVAVNNGYFDAEITPVHVKERRTTKTIDKDEFPKPDTTIESLTRLRPCFVSDGTGTVTPGNASGLNDGAAAVLVAKYSEAKAMSLKEPMVRIVSWAQVGIDPSVMGLAPIDAVKKALHKACWTLDEVDIFELNEAFAVQSVAVIRELGVPIDKVNICGGAIGLGHPIGASGCRILVTLLHSMKRLNKSKGVAGLCIGGGMGIAMCVESLS